MTDLEYLKKYYCGNIEDALEQLNQGIPVQYIVGNVDFYGNTIFVNKNVLIPRFETEELVEKTTKIIKKNFSKKIDILDLCTGSGCIAISLNKNVLSNVVGSDISIDALELAQKNNSYNKTNVKFIKSNILENIDEKYDVIISNPPYISYDEKIDEKVKNNEPFIALYASNNGLYFYEEILKNCLKNLKDKFLLAFEIGEKQSDDIVNLINKYLSDVQIKVLKDMQGRNRFIFIAKHLEI